MAIGNKGDKVEIAFFAFRPTNDNQGYVGAILVTDERGIPQEFRCTHPVKPTAVQKALYGKNLESHVSLELCGKPLLEALTTDPVICLVESRELVELREFVSLPVIFLQRPGEVLEEADQSQIVGRDQHLNKSLNGVQQLSARCHSQWESDFEKMQQALDQASHYIDLLEPFDRITTSLSILAARDERFR